ncbi:MAG: hypothetical protein ABEH59_12350 [Halobacteriales archaeon]
MTGPSRRALLGGVSTAISAGLAGCLGGGGQSTPTTEASVIERTGFDGRFLVVELAPDHDVSRLNLIGPEGSAVAQTDVATGETKASLEILKVEPQPAMEHYTPGRHEIIAVQESDEVTREIELRPRFELIGIRQNRDPEYDSQLANLVFTISNTGTARSWVYDIAFSGAPYFAANSELSDRPGVPFMTQPEKNYEFIITPGANQEFVSSNPPFLFNEEDHDQCDGEYELTAKIGFPTNAPLKIDLRATMGGDLANVGLPDKHTCSKFSVSVVEVMTAKGDT